VVVPTHDPQSPLITSTPDNDHTLPTPREGTKQYTVQPGDTLGLIAEAFGISIDVLQQANGLTDQNVLGVGQTLEVPAPSPGLPGSSFKIIPDSELVDGPAAATFDVEAYVVSQRGYLGGYTQDVNQQTLSGPQVVSLVAQNYSVNPRLLLALLEYRGHWVTSLQPAIRTRDYPLGLVEQNHVGLYRQLTWAANELNRGFYLWRANAVGHWVLHDDGIVPINATINAGTAGVQGLFAALDDRTTWDKDVNPFGLFQTYFFLFGNPFDEAIDPLTPANLAQPQMDLPFESGAAWAFTGGPHASWDSGSAWGALDFAPSDVLQCAVSRLWISAIASGFIVRASDGAVIEDLDGDGYEQTGWDVLYMHVAAKDRVQPGTYVYTGDHIGHPSCEGGIANAAHLHLARKYNGEWIAADGPLPFVLDGWISAGNGTEYDGTLRRGSTALEAFEGFSQLNEITR
jgi:murein DD-endopeptidase MepM/ murein hydrolase activator NlpD